MAWHDSWAQMKQKKTSQPQAETRKTGAVPKRERAKSTAAKASPNKKTPGE
jgi:hypothetical protein